MAYEPEKLTPTRPEWLPQGFGLAEPFLGFSPPTSNTTYTPNQFFDTVLPYSSRGVVRLVAYMIRKTLGWCDRDGNPQEELILVSYQDLITHAGISREMIRQAVDEAIAANFIRCVRPGRASGANLSAVKALYELRWDDRGEYIKDPKKFKGFFEGDGHRTDIPNQFFDDLIPKETLAVIKVVGSIIRFSIGFQARHGRRRQQAQLSYNHIQNYTKVKNRTTLSQAIQQAIDRNYIIRLHQGFFTSDKTDQVTTIYTLRWVDSDIYNLTSQKNVPESIATDQSEKRTRKTRQNQSEKRTRTSQKNVPVLK